MAVTISGMFGNGKTYFAGSPVVIDISGLEWWSGSPFTVVRVEVKYNGSTVGDFPIDTGGQTSISLDISSALMAIWGDYNFDTELAAAAGGLSCSRMFREYSLVVHTEYLASDGVYTTTTSGEFSGGRCALGSLTEWERSNVGSKENADMSYWEGSNPRNGDASTKPTASPERVGSTSITSYVDVSNSGGTTARYYAMGASGAPVVLRDSQPYVDFLFLNRRGAIETCSGLMKEAMGISVSTQEYSRTERPSFNPGRSLAAIGTDGRRSWQMSSGFVTREWAEWWTMEFLGGKRKRWWMLWQGPGQQSPRYVPVTVKSAKNDISIYDKSKQQMPHVDFTVTLALEG